MGIVTSTQGRGVNMGQAQQNRRAVLIVEDDAELRGFAARLLEDGELDTIECESAEAALATMLIRGRDVAMIFADIRLSGAMDGIDLAREVRMRWPWRSLGIAPLLAPDRCHRTLEGKRERCVSCLTLPVGCPKNAISNRAPASAQSIMRDSAQVTVPGAITSVIVAVSTTPNRQNRST
jgi:CheY-like chemotaxis protein